MLRDLCALYIGGEEGHVEPIEKNREGLSVERISSGEACLGYDLSQIDCLVIRYDLPDMTGVELVERLQAMAPDIPTILVAESGNESVASAAISAGVTEYLSSAGQHATLASRVLHFAAQYRRNAPRDPSAVDTDPRMQNLKSKAMDKAPAGIAVTDPSLDDNPIVYVNERFAELTGYEQSTVTGQNCRFLQGPATSAAPIASMRKAIQNEEPVTVELQNYRADGTLFWNEVRIRPLRNAAGDVTHYVGFQQDITERKRREQALREERALTRAIFDALPDAFLVIDTDKTCIRWSESIPEVTGYTDAEIAQMGPSDFIDDAGADLAASVTEAVVSDGGERIVELDIETADGGTLPYEFALAQITDEDGSVLGAVITGRNISERQARTAELQGKNERLERFAKVVSHDIRNPLQVADGQLRLAEAECDSSHIHSAKQALGRMETLVDELLTLSRKGEVVTETEPVDNATLVERCWENVVTGEATLECHTETVLEADAGRLREVFENLFRNAIEHGSPYAGLEQHSAESDPETHSLEADSGEGGKGLTITVGDTETGIYIADDGSGIPRTERQQIFDSGYSTASNGTGYGLHIVQEIVTAHGWSIQVSESDTGGACFEIDTE